MCQCGFRYHRNNHGIAHSSSVLFIKPLCPSFTDLWTSAIQSKLKSQYSCPGFPGPRSAKLGATIMGSLCKIKISWLVWVPVIVRVGGFPVPFYVNFSYQPWPAALPPGLRPARKRDLVKMGGYILAKVRTRKVIIYLAKSCQRWIPIPYSVPSKHMNMHTNSNMKLSVDRRCPRGCQSRLSR